MPQNRTSPSATDRPATGFHIDVIDLIERRPEYLRLSPVTYVLGIGYERMVNITSTLANRRILLNVQPHKPSVSR